MARSPVGDSSCLEEALGVRMLRLSRTRPCVPAAGTHGCSNQECVPQPRSATAALSSCAPSAPHLLAGSDPAGVRFAITLSRKNALT